MVVTAIDPALEARAELAAQRPLAKETLDAYASDWRRFETWCVAHGESALPASERVICLYLKAAAEGYTLNSVDRGPLTFPPLRYSSLTRLYAAIRTYHDDAGHRLETLRDVRFTLKNIGKAQKGGIASRAKRPLEIEQLIQAAALLPYDLAGLRDRAVLLFGCATALRRGNIAALDVGDVDLSPRGAVVAVRRSKTDQLGEGRTLAVGRASGPGCPVGALEAWLEASGIGPGPLFRVVRAGKPLGRLLQHEIVTIVKRAAASLGLDPAEYAGHSLRRGFVTSAAKAGRDLDKIMHTTGHTNVVQVRKYIARADPFASTASDGLFDTAPSGPPVAAEPVEKPPASHQQATETIAEPGSLAIHPTTGQALVNRRRLAKPEYLRDGRAADLVWAASQAKALLKAGLSIDAAARGLTDGAGLTKADGSPISADDVKRWLR